jgi:hypothetical protein
MKSTCCSFKQRFNLIFFYIRTLEGAGWSKEGLRREGNKIMAMDDYDKPDKTWYYTAPKEFIGGDKTAAYNGWLEFDLGTCPARIVCDSQGSDATSQGTTSTRIWAKASKTHSTSFSSQQRKPSH